ncbi:hypothetical protein Ciccas_009572, partial [Cichlidogyrus casuarinus]
RSPIQLTTVRLPSAAKVQTKRKNVRCCHIEQYARVSDKIVDQQTYRTDMDDAVTSPPIFDSIFISDCDDEAEEVEELIVPHQVIRRQIPSLRLRLPTDLPCSVSNIVDDESCSCVNSNPGGRPGISLSFTGKLSQKSGILTMPKQLSRRLATASKVVSKPPKQLQRAKQPEDRGLVEESESCLSAWSTITRENDILRATKNGYRQATETALELLKFEIAGVRKSSPMTNCSTLPSSRFEPGLVMWSRLANASRTAMK